MKRFITLLMIAVVIALSLSACNSGSMNENAASEPVDQNQDDSSEYTNDLEWEGIYSHADSYKSGWLFMEITDCDGNGFQFKFYSEEDADEQQQMYLEGIAAIRSDEPHKADYMGVTFSIYADSGEITVDGSDYGTVDGTYARYEDGDI